MIPSSGRQTNSLYVRPDGRTYDQISYSLNARRYCSPVFWYEEEGEVVSNEARIICDADDHADVISRAGASDLQEQGPRQRNLARLGSRVRIPSPAPVSAVSCNSFDAIFSFLNLLTAGVLLAL
jgi:hypothetical protein